MTQNVPRTRVPAFGPILCLAAGLMVTPSLAQGLDAPDAIDSIVQSDVNEEQAEAGAETGKIIAAIEKSAENTSAVRKVTKLDRLDIVFLPDSAPTEGGPPADITEKLAEYDADIAGLRQEITGNAMLFHAIDSRSILIQDVLAIEFDDDGGAVIYAAGRPSG
ncbi:hypothetical protein EJC49_06410 [Aquibium carbonis]|uniref:Uncharacterized protein n=1 Tax=Aquibium carbonis TaxID=2495581 RepID=A0A3R9YUB2_9HYPH|nr:hypothetical protein [Aquibium carbonis]RST87245.1 hypothetical protein EJC49_06410 [Aquibium carbonis]